MTNEQFTRAVGCHMDMVYRLALSYLRSSADAEDAAQEVFLRLLRCRTDFESEEHLKHWLLRVTINESKRIALAPWRRAEPLDEQLEAPAFSTAESRETYQLVMDLPRKYRLVIHLYYYEGYSTAEVARLLRIPPSTVRTQLERGRKLLKERLLEAENV